MTPDYPLPILGFIGTILSLYVFYVEQRLAANSEYHPACDSETLGVSCSRVFGSDAGHLLSFIGLVPKHSVLDLSNGLTGTMFYLYLLILPNLTTVPYEWRA